MPGNCFDTKDPIDAELENHFDKMLDRADQEADETAKEDGEE